MEIGYDSEENEFFIYSYDENYDYIDGDYHNPDTPITGSPYLALDFRIETSDGFDEELCDMDILNDGLAYYIPVNYDNTFFQLLNSDGVTYDYEKGTFSFSGGDTSQLIEDYGYNMEDLRTYDRDYLRMLMYNKPIDGYSCSLGEAVIEWVYNFYFPYSLSCNVSFKSE